MLLFFKNKVMKRNIENMEDVELLKFILGSVTPLHWVTIVSVKSVIHLWPVTTHLVTV